MNEIKTSVYVKKIVYRKGDWGIYSLLDIENNETFTAKGIFPEPKPNVVYSLIGNWINDEKYGEQVDIVFVNESIDVDKMNVDSFLGIILTPRQIKSFKEVYDNPIEVIASEDIGSITKVKGIGESSAKKLIERFALNKKYFSFISAMSQYGLTANTIKTIANIYPDVSKAVYMIQHDPYRLIIDVPGIGWAKADEIALKVGIKKFSTYRIGGYIMHTLLESNSNGDTWLNSQQIVDKVYTLFPDMVLDEQTKKKIILSTRDALDELVDKNIVWRNEERTKISMVKTRNLEVGICRELMRLLKQDRQMSKDEVEEFNKRMSQVEEEQGFKYSDEQANAIKLALSKNVLAINSPAGTGKTTVVKGIISCSNECYNLTALSGMAASRLGEVVGQDGSTIHRLLGYGLGDGGEWLKNRDNPLMDSVILDESSMVDGELFYRLVQSIDNGKQLIMLGDLAQLESLGACSVFRDIVNSGVVPVVEFTQIFRQAKKSAIITEATKVRMKEPLCSNDFYGNDIRGEMKDFLLQTYAENKLTLPYVLKYYEKSVEATQDTSKIQIISPMRNKGDSSCLSLNRHIQKYLLNNAYIRGKPLQINKDYSIYVGDRIINTKNKTKIETSNGLVDVFNGYQGKVVSIDYKNNSFVCDFDLCGEVEVDYKMFDSIDLAYAITCHKFQGSQRDIVIGALDYTAYKLLNKELLYTMITRAKKRCILCAKTDALIHATRTSGVQARQTFLCGLLKEEN